MYTPAPFRVDDPAEQQAFIAAHPLATLVIANAHGVDAIHLPLVLENDCLLGHFAKANEAWHSLTSPDVLAIFHHPGHYISANWYPSKARDHKVVPTWNYQAIHIRGRLHWLDAPQDIHACLAAFTARMESSEARPWTLDDAPAGFIDGLSRAIRAFRIDITHIESKYKLSQNQSAENRSGVQSALRRQQSAAAEHMANLVAQFAKPES